MLQNLINGYHFCLACKFCEIEYLTVTCERVEYKTGIIITQSYWQKFREICKAGCADFTGKCDYLASLKTPKVLSFKKKLPQKLHSFSKEKQETGQMGEPTPTFVCYGGTYTISSDDEDNSPSNTDPTKKLVANKKAAADVSEIPIDFRSWENLATRGSTSNGYNFKFKVMCYNVLAQCAVESHPHLYRGCSEDEIKWNLRFDRLYAEITSLDPDIICLQEVQASHIDSFYSRFEKIGYDSVFKQKTGDKEDGCAIYFKKHKFKLKDHLNVEFFQPRIPVLNRHNVGVMVKLAPLCAPDNPIVVASTHLLYNPKREDVRLAQMQLFLAEIDRFAFYNRENGSGHLPIILTGDLNSTPESAVVKLLKYGHASAHISTAYCTSDFERIGVTDNCQHLTVYLNRRAGRETSIKDLQIYSSEYSESYPGQSDDAKPGPLAGLFNSGDLYHTLDLSSVYSSRKLSGAWEATTCPGWVTVDYMFFSRCSNLTLTDRLRLPKQIECVELNLPNHIYGSDHFCLVAAFELTPPLHHKTQ